MGANSREDGVDWFQFGVPLALLLGLIGMVTQFNKDQKMGFSVLTLFIMTGLAIIVYLNQDDPQPRERDYSYVGSFLAFSIWIGIGAAAILDKLKQFIKDPKLANRLSTAVIVFLLLAAPGVMLVANYFEHNRTGNFVAWDYSYNLLQSCEPDGIIFTNGDNDTFPLWYLQTVEKIRKDVTVVNLALLNTDWYIRQMRDSRAPGKEFINLSDQRIKEISSTVQPWRTQTISIPAKDDPLNPKKAVEWSLKPTYAGRFLKVQDIMVLRILLDNAWRFPVYFAVTVSPQNRLGLDPFINMEGLVFRVQSHKTQFIDADAMHRNLMSDIGPEEWISDFSEKEFVPISDVQTNSWSRDYQPGYLFRNLGNKDVYYNPQTMRLLQNYRSGYQQLALYHLLNGKNSTDDAWKDTVLSILGNMEENIPEDVIPIHSKDIYFQLGQIYAEAGNKERAIEILNTLNKRQDINISDQIKYAQSYLIMKTGYDDAIGLYEELLEKIKVMEITANQGFAAGKQQSQQEFNFLQKGYSDIIFGLYTAYKETGQIEKAGDLLTEHMKKNPNDPMAKNLLKDLEKLKN